VVAGQSGMAKGIDLIKDGIDTKEARFANGKFGMFASKPQIKYQKQDAAKLNLL
jgi:hypothetical protein